MHSYKDGRREGVVFAFVRGNEILLENRDEAAGDIFCPNGSIEESDKAPGVDYIDAALRREVFEEFGGQIAMTAYARVGELYTPGINVLFYVHVVTGWTGDFPAYTTEDGAPFARLFWARRREACALIPYESRKALINLIDNQISQRSNRNG